MSSKRFRYSFEGSEKSFSHRTNQSRHDKTCKFKVTVKVSENISKQYTCSKPWCEMTFSKTFNFTQHKSVCRRL